MILVNSTKRLIAVFSLLFCAAFAQQKRPNIIVILSDDVGFEEFGVYDVKKGVPSLTPNIDKLGASGTVFKNAWGQAICGPSRAMFYSGNYAMQTGAYDNKLAYVPGMKRVNQDLDRLPNFVKVLHDAGYKTAVAGKWHNPSGGILGVHNKLLGVDQYVVYNSYPAAIKKLTGETVTPDENWEIAAISKQPILSRYWKPHLVKDGKLMKTTMKDYGPDLLTNYIKDFIKDNAKSDQPFLAFYPMVLAHSSHCITPIEVAQGQKASNAHFKHGSPEGRAIFENQIRYMDKLVGDIVKTVEDQGIADNTIILYSSDNGTTSVAKGKGVEYGVHIPFIVSGKDIKQRGLTDELTDFTDVLPTLAEFAGAKIPSKYNVDGQSLVSFLTGKSETTKPVIYSQPGVSSLARTKTHMLEAVSPVYGYPKGRFYATNGSYDGRGYENVTHNAAHAETRAEFDTYLEQYHNLTPKSFDDPLWQEHKALLRGYKFFNNEKRKKAHLKLPLNYQFYDPSF